MPRRPACRRVCAFMEDELRIVEPDGLRTQELRCPRTERSGTAQ